jgi:hypothetical protein
MVNLLNMNLQPDPNESPRMLCEICSDITSNSEWGIFAIGAGLTDTEFAEGKQFRRMPEAVDASASISSHRGLFAAINHFFLPAVPYGDDRNTVALHVYRADEKTDRGAAQRQAADFGCQH